MIDLPANCTKCKLHRGVDLVCEAGIGPMGATVMVVGKMPNSDRYQHALQQDLRDAGIDIIHTKIYWASALKCRNFEANASNGDVKACREYLEQEIEFVKPKFILTMGNEALLSVTGHSGIMKWRGKPLEAHGAKVLATISPAAVLARPQNRPGYQADLKLFASIVKGEQVGKIIPIDALVVDTPAKLKELKQDLAAASLVYFDIETNIVPLGEFDPDARIISLAGTYIVEDELRGFKLPLYHPESVWLKKWRAVLKFIGPELAAVPKRIGHNGKFDSRWLRRFGVEDMWNTFDTMLAAHLLDENVLKGLKAQCQMRLGVEPWGVDTKSLLTMPIKEVLQYNFLDTYYGYLLYQLLIKDLKKHPRLARIFKMEYQPANRDLIRTEQRGLWVDVDRLNERLPQKRADLAIIEAAIAEWLPDRESSDWPTDSKGRPIAVNFNPSNFARWFLFEWLDLPVVSRGKEKDDGSPGSPSMAAEVLRVWGEVKNPHPVIKLMLERAGLQKDLTFLEAFDRLYDDQHRIRTTFKLAGTVTGRLASGKEDKDKFSGSASKIKGFNAQQIPRDPFIRGCVGSTPGWTSVEADYSQIELRIAAFCAHEHTMIRLYNQGADIHMETTMAVTKLPRSQITKELRKKIGKPVNFGFLYGMGWMKFIEIAFNNYGVRFSEQEARAYRKSYFELFPDLLQWHERQRRLVRAYGQVQSPIGRIRHLPDINSPEAGVRAEAERQAINSPVQGLASDMAVMGMNLINERLRDEGLDDSAYCLGLVHDAVNFEVRDDLVAHVLPIIKDSMEDMGHLRRKFGLNMTLPIIADLKVGRHWGDSIELTPEQVYDYPGLEKIQEYNIAH